MYASDFNYHKIIDAIKNRISDPLYDAHLLLSLSQQTYKVDVITECNEPGLGDESDNYDLR